MSSSEGKIPELSSLVPPEMFFLAPDLAKWRANLHRRIQLLSAKDPIRLAYDKHILQQSESLRTHMFTNDRSDYAGNLPDLSDAYVLNALSIVDTDTEQLYSQEIIKVIEYALDIENRSEKDQVVKMMNSLSKIMIEAKKLSRADDGNWTDNVHKKEFKIGARMAAVTVNRHIMNPGIKISILDPLGLGAMTLYIGAKDLESDNGEMKLGLVSFATKGYLENEKERMSDSGGHSSRIIEAMDEERKNKRK